MLLAGLLGADTGAPVARPSAAATQSEEKASPVRRTGDQITLKSGKVLHGVKIVRRTPICLILEVIPGVEPLVIPAKQVTSVTYGALGPRYNQPPPLEPLKPGDRIDVLPATKTSPKLIEKMTAPFTTEPQVFEEQDVVNAILTLAIMSGVPVSFDDKVEEIPVETRLVSFKLDVGTSMDGFVKETLEECAPWLVVQYQFDRLKFKLREEPPAKAPSSERELAE